MLKKFENYISSRILLLRIEGAEKLSKTLASVFTVFILLMFAGSFLFALTIAFAIWIGDIIGSYINGFLVMAGIYLLILILAYFFRKPLFERPMRNNIISNLFKEAKK
ncbi:MAG: phage holin family protein [Bacteroidales bacterium]